MSKTAQKPPAEEHDYGNHPDGTPRRVPIRLLSAAESLIYWFVIFVPIIWIGGHFWQPMMDAVIGTDSSGKDIVVQVTKDAGSWFDKKMALTVMGWLPFGLASNLLIRLVNKFVLRTDWARPSKISGGLSGASRGRKISKGYAPPKEYT